jgi:hypothetical protein
MSFGDGFASLECDHFPGFDFRPPAGAAKFVLSRDAAGVYA